MEGKCAENFARFIMNWCYLHSWKVGPTLYVPICVYVHKTHWVFGFSAYPELVGLQLGAWFCFSFDIIEA